MRGGLDRQAIWQGTCRRLLLTPQPCHGQAAQVQQRQGRKGGALLVTRLRRGRVQQPVFSQEYTSQSVSQSRVSHYHIPTNGTHGPLHTRSSLSLVESRDSDYPDPGNLPTYLLWQVPTRPQSALEI